MIWPGNDAIAKCNVGPNVTRRHIICIPISWEASPCPSCYLTYSQQMEVPVCGKWNLSRSLHLIVSASSCQLLSKKYQEDKEIGNNTQGRKQFLRSMTCKDRIHRKKERRLRAQNAKSPDNLMVACSDFNLTKHKGFLKWTFSLFVTLERKLNNSWQINVSFLLFPWLNKTHKYCLTEHFKKTNCYFLQK